MLEVLEIFLFSILKSLSIFAKSTEEEQINIFCTPPSPHENHPHPYLGFVEASKKLHGQREDDCAVLLRRDRVQRLQVSERIVIF